MKKTMLKSKLHNLFGKKNTMFKKEGDYFFRLFEGFRIYSNFPMALDFLYKQIFVDEVYGFEPSKQEPFIIDAGANMGFGVVFWKSRFPDAEIIAIEPSREVIKVLQKNIESNGLTKVKVLEKALWNESTKIEFTTNEKISGSLILEKKLPSNYMVETVTLEELINKPVDLLKIDIEGAEKVIISQIESKIDLIQNIFIEYHSFVHEEQYLSKILTLFEKNNFRYYIEGEYKNTSPFKEVNISLNQDLQLNIWAKKRS